MAAGGSAAIAGAGGTMREMTIRLGFGGATGGAGFGSGGAGLAWTTAGGAADKAGGSANGGVRTLSDPEMRRGMATPPATAPASKIDAMTRVTPLMVPAPRPTTSLERGNQQAGPAA